MFHLRFLPLLAVPSRSCRSHTVKGTKCATFLIFELEKFFRYFWKSYWICKRVNFLKNIYHESKNFKDSFKCSLILTIIEKQSALIPFLEFLFFSKKDPLRVVNCSPVPPPPLTYAERIENILNYHRKQKLVGAIRNPRRNKHKTQHKRREN